MEHDAVFRSAFIVESVQVRIARRSQKKFAILTISDGIERYGACPSGQIYMKKKAILLNENQLLYAVLQVDKKEEELR